MRPSEDKARLIPLDLGPLLRFVAATACAVVLVVAQPAGTSGKSSGVEFAAACYSLNVNVSPSASGEVTWSPSPNCGGVTYNAGTVVQLTASPYSGYVFSNWSGDATGSSNPVSITMNSNKSVIANLQAATVTGSVTGLSISPATVRPGEAAQITGTVTNTGTVTANYHLYTSSSSVCGSVGKTSSLSSGQSTLLNLTCNVPTSATSGTKSIDVYFEMAPPGQPWQNNQKVATLTLTVQSVQDPVLEDVGVSATGSSTPVTSVSVPRDQQFRAWFLVRNFNTQVDPVGLGLSIRSPAGDVFDDPSRDTKCDVPANSSRWCSRYFQVPLTAAVGSYTVIFGLWSDQPGSSTLVRREERPGWLTVTTSTFSVSLSSSTTDGTSNLGQIEFRGTRYNLPTTITTEAASSVGAAMYPPSGYVYDHWERTSGVSVVDFGDGTASVTVTGDGSLKAIFKPGPSFDISVSPSSLTVNPGSSGSATVTVTSRNDFSGNVDLALSLVSGAALPTWLSPGFSPNPRSVSANSSATSALQISVNTSAPAGTYALSVSGNRGSIVKYADLQLTISQRCYALSLSVHGGSGSIPIASSPDCPGGKHAQGTVVNLTATPAAGWQVVHWHGTDNDSSQSTSNTVTMDSDENPSVHYVEVPPTNPVPQLSVGTYNSSVQPDETQAISFTMTNSGGPANSAYLDVSFSSGLDVISASATAGTSRRIQPGARIWQKTDVDAPSLTSVDLLYELAVPLPSGQSATMTLTVQAKASGPQWIKYRTAMNPQGVSEHNYNPDSFVRAPTSGETDQQGWYAYKLSIQVVPISVCYTLMLSVHGGSGNTPTASSPNCGEKYTPGTRVSLTAVPSQGWQVAHWHGTDYESSTSTSNTVTMSGDKSVSVHYEQTYLAKAVVKAEWREWAQDQCTPQKLPSEVPVGRDVCVYIETIGYTDGEPLTVSITEVDCLLKDCKTPTAELLLTVNNNRAFAKWRPPWKPDADGRGEIDLTLDPDYQFEAAGVPSEVLYVKGGFVVSHTGFRIHFVREGSDAPPSLTDRDRDDIPDLINYLAEDLDATYEKLVRRLRAVGWTVPDALPTVRVVDLPGWAGEARPNDCEHPEISIDTQNLDDEWRRKRTILHELFHIFQFENGFDCGFRSDNQRWVAEGTARWLEMEVFEFYPDQSNLYMLDTQLENQAYGASLFWHYLTSVRYAGNVDRTLELIGAILRSENLFDSLHNNVSTDESLTDVMFESFIAEVLKGTKIDTFSMWWTACYDPPAARRPGCRIDVESRKLDITAEMLSWRSSPLPIKLDRWDSRLVRIDWWSHDNSEARVTLTMDNPQAQVKVLVQRTGFEAVVLSLSTQHEATFTLAPQHYGAHLVLVNSKNLPLPSFNLVVRVETTKSGGGSGAPGASQPGTGGSIRPMLLETLPPPDATQYHIQIVPFGNDGPGVNVIRNAENALRLAPPVMGEGNYVLLPGMTYRWRYRWTTAVTSVREDSPAWGDWSGWRSFRTPLPSSATIEPSSPRDHTTVHAERVMLQWWDSNPSIFYYEVQLSTDPEFKTDPPQAIAPVWWNFVHGGITTPINSWHTPDLQRAVTYFWRVRPRVQGDGTPVPWSQTWRFSTP